MISQLWSFLKPSALLIWQMILLLRRICMRRPEVNIWEILLHCKALLVWRILLSLTMLTKCMGSNSNSLCLIRCRTNHRQAKRLWILILNLIAPKGLMSLWVLGLRIPLYQASTRVQKPLRFATKWFSTRRKEESRALSWILNIYTTLARTKSL